VRRHAFNGIALLSLLIAGLLCVGYVSGIGLAVVHNSLRTGSARDVDVSLDHGSVICYFEYVQPVPASVPVGWRVFRRFQFLPLRAPDWRRSLWTFDAEPLSVTNPPGVRVFLLTFPIWCACVPFLIAPTIWLVKGRRRRIRQRQATEGFAIVQRG
jgi:hypothetical protein